MDMRDALYTVINWGLPVCLGILVVVVSLYLGYIIGRAQ